VNMESLKGHMAGQDCLVVGCGPTACPSFGEPVQDFWTIGCNRSIPTWKTDFGLCIEVKQDPIWKSLQKHPCAFLFTHHTRDIAPRNVYFPANRDVREWMDGYSGPREIRLAQSTFYAAAIAAWLGFETIGLLGVDLSEDRYPEVGEENRVWGMLGDLLGSKGHRLLNVSRHSRLKSVPYAPLAEVRRK